MRYTYFVVMIFCTANIAYAYDTERLTEGCTELLRIYEMQDKSRVLAAFATSVSDALKAGYCRGVIDEFRRNHNCTSDWRKQAVRIVETAAIRPDGSADSLLVRSCGNY
jgi:hypothetical protein